MRLAILGDNRGPRHRQIVEQLVREMRPAELVILLRQGLGRIAYDVAEELGIPVLRFGHVRRTLLGGHRRLPDGTVRRGAHAFTGSVELATCDAARAARPDLVICIAPRRAATHRQNRRHHDEMLAVFKAHGVRCIVGRFDKGKKLSWAVA